MFEYFIRLSQHCYATRLGATGRGLLTEMVGGVESLYIEKTLPFLIEVLTHLLEYY